MNTKEFILGSIMAISGLLILIIFSGVRTCADSCIGCQSWEESLWAVLPSLVGIANILIGTATIIESIGEK